MLCRWSFPLLFRCYKYMNFWVHKLSFFSVFVSEINLICGPENSCTSVLVSHCLDRYHYLFNQKVHKGWIHARFIWFLLGINVVTVNLKGNNLSQDQILSWTYRIHQSWTLVLWEPIKVVSHTFPTGLCHHACILLALAPAFFSHAFMLL